MTSKKLYCFINCIFSRKITHSIYTIHILNKIKRRFYILLLLYPCIFINHNSNTHFVIITIPLRHINRSRCNPQYNYNKHNHTQKNMWHILKRRFNLHPYKHKFNLTSNINIIILIHANYYINITIIAFMEVP